MRIISINDLMFKRNDINWHTKHFRSAHLHNYFLFEQVSNCNLHYFSVKSIPSFCNLLFSLRASIFISLFYFLISYSDQLKLFAIIFSLAQVKSKFDLNQGPIRAFTYQNFISSYFTILKSYFINYTIQFYNTLSIPIFILQYNTLK